MTAFAFDAAPSAGLVTRFASAAARVAAWPFRVIEARRNFAMLAAMDEHELRDIGLSRSDVANATALPLDEDPTRFLANAAADLVSAQRAAARRVAV